MVGVRFRSLSTGIAGRPTDWSHPQPHPTPTLPQVALWAQPAPAPAAHDAGGALPPAGRRGRLQPQPPTAAGVLGVSCCPDGWRCGMASTFPTPLLYAVHSRSSASSRDSVPPATSSCAACCSCVQPARLQNHTHQPCNSHPSPQVGTTASNVALQGATAQPVLSARLKLAARAVGFTVSVAGFKQVSQGSIPQISS